MRKLLIVAAIVLFVATGCSKKEFAPVVAQVTEYLELHQSIDPTALISDVEKEGLTITVEKNNVNIDQPGEYTIEYSISKGRKSVQRTFTFIVKDDDAPTIECPEVIQIPYGNTLKFSKYAKAEDIQDGDVTDSIRYEGTVDIWKTGSYKIVITASDKYGNQTSRDVTVKVVSDSSESYKKEILGTYKDVTYEDGQVPTLTLKKNNEFEFYLNSCSTFNRYEGYYSQYQNTLYLTCEDFEFSSIKESCVMRFIVEVDGSLTFDNQIATICAPNLGDCFVKQDN